MRRIILIHELFGHKKRILFSTPENTFKRTPELEVPGVNLKCREAGSHIELSIFGALIRDEDITEEFARQFLRVENWSQQPQYDFNALVK